MEYKKLLLSIVAVLALTMLISNVSARVSITAVEIDDVEVYPASTDVSFMAGEKVPVRILFHTTSDARDARVKAWIAGSSGLSASTDRFDLVDDKDYVKSINLELPEKIDLNESLDLVIVIESKDGVLDTVTVPVSVQRESYQVDVLDVDMDSRVMAGSDLAMNVVLKNRGRQFAEDTFVRVRIPALGIEKKAYFEDLAPVDQANPDKEDSAERRVLVKIPSSAKPGIYTLELEAFSDDSSTTITRKIVVVGASEDSIIVASAKSKTFAAGEDGTYTVTLVNSGNSVRVYELVAETPEGISVEFDEPVVAVSAGSSKTVKLIANADEAGTYNFVVNVQSDSDLVKKEVFVANVEGTSSSGNNNGGSPNTTVLLTVVLAIIFVVLLVVLIVLLTRKPEKSKEFGENYY